MLFIDPFFSLWNACNVIDFGVRILVPRLGSLEVQWHLYRPYIFRYLSAWKEWGCYFGRSTRGGRHLSFLGFQVIIEGRTASYKDPYRRSA